MNAEYEKGEKKSKEETGFNEQELDLDIEIRAGEWQNLRKFHAYKRRSRQWKILATYKAISNRIRDLEKLFYPLVRDHPEKAGKLLRELKKMRVMQNILLQCLVWEKRESLTKDMVPKELWELIE